MERLNRYGLAGGSVPQEASSERLKTVAISSLHSASCCVAKEVSSPHSAPAARPAAYWHASHEGQQQASIQPDLMGRHFLN